LRPAKKLKKIIIALGAVVFILILGEIIYFHYILSQEDELKRADVIIVFAGSPERIETGFGLADAGYAPFLIVSPASENQMQIYRSKYADSTTFSWIVENQARTTVENAILTKNIILKNHFKSVILVTSYYHLPRSFFLMKVAFLGSKIRIQPYGNSIGSKIVGEHSRIRIIDRLIYNELLDFWGSLFELLNYKIKGELPLKN